MNSTDIIILFQLGQTPHGNTAQEKHHLYEGILRDNAKDDLFWCFVTVKICEDLMD